MSDNQDNNFSAGQARLWDLPFMEDEDTASKASVTNALNRRSDWVYEPPEEEEEILPPTLEEIEAIRQAARDEGFAEGRQAGYGEGRAEGLQNGHQEGYEAGLAEGRQQGLEEGQADIATQLESLGSQLERLHQPLEQATEASRTQLVRLAVSLARAVIRTEVATNENVILQALSEGIKVLPVTETRYQIHMNPDDLALMNTHFGADTIQEKGWQLVEAPAMARGGCDIITTHNAVDVSVERRCRDVLDTFLLEQGLSGE